MRLVDYFEEKLSDLPASRPTRAYVTDLFTKQAVSERAIDYSQDSVVLAYAEVRAQRDLETLQALGDWVLWVDSVLPGALEGFREASRAVAQASYYRCYQLVPEWRLYEELADTLPSLIRHTRIMFEAGEPREQTGLTDIELIAY